MSHGAGRATGFFGGNTVAGTCFPPGNEGTAAVASLTTGALAGAVTGSALPVVGTVVGLVVGVGAALLLSYVIPRADGR